MIAKAHAKRGFLQSPPGQAGCRAVSFNRLRLAGLQTVGRARFGRTRRAGVPAKFQAARTKPEIAIEKIDSLRAAGLRFGTVLADAGYALSPPSRQALRAGDLRWAVGIPRHQKVYPADTVIGSSIYPTFPSAPRCAPSQPPSRRAGSVSRAISN